MMAANVNHFDIDRYSMAEHCGCWEEMSILRPIMIGICSTINKDIFLSCWAKGPINNIF
jgi:hypothetical protein